MFLDINNQDNLKSALIYILLDNMELRKDLETERVCARITSEELTRTQNELAALKKGDDNDEF